MSTFSKAIQPPVISWALTKLSGIEDVSPTKITEILYSFDNQLIKGEPFRSKEGVIIDNDLIVLTLLVRFY